MDSKRPRRARCCSLSVLLVSLAGCGALNIAGPDAGVPFCIHSSSCKTGEICHPTAKTCVSTCAGDADCPLSAKSCEAAAGATSADGGIEQVCHCSTDQICANGTSGTVCSRHDAICTPKCTGDSQCPSNRACEISSGQCLAPIDVIDAGSSGDGGAPCSSGSCGGGSICNFDNGLCETPRACIAASPQPDGCTNGQFCAATTCEEIPVATCTNFAAGSGRLTWTPSSDRGPVIWNLVEVEDEAGYCAANRVAFSLRLSAYRLDADWPAQLTTVSGFNYVNSSGVEADATASLRPSDYLPNGRLATFKLTLCATVNAPFSAGFYFSRGNPACLALTQGTQGTAP